MISNVKVLIFIPGEYNWRTGIISPKEEKHLELNIIDKVKSGFSVSTEQSRALQPELRYFLKLHNLIKNYWESGNPLFSHWFTTWIYTNHLASDVKFFIKKWKSSWSLLSQGNENIYKETQSLWKRTNLKIQRIMLNGSC